jgi:hypothetical protein
LCGGVKKKRARFGNAPDISGKEVAVGIHTDSAGDQLIALQDTPQAHDKGGTEGKTAQERGKNQAHRGNDDLQQTSAHIAKVEVMDAEHSNKESQQGSDHTVAGLGVAHDKEGRLAFGAFSCPCFSLSAAIGAIVYAKATLIITLFAGIFLVTQLSATISAKHKIHAFRIWIQLSYHIFSKKATVWAGKTGKNGIFFV